MTDSGHTSLLSAQPLQRDPLQATICPLCPRPFCFIDDLAECVLDHHRIYLYFSLMSDIPYMWILLVFWLSWSSNPNLFILIACIPCFVVTFMMSICVINTLSCCVCLRESNASNTHSISRALLWSIGHIFVWICTIFSSCAPNFILMLISCGSLFSEKNTEQIVQNQQTQYISYIKAVLQYCTNHGSFNENLKRIVAANYYLQSSLHEWFNETLKFENSKQLQQITTMHQEYKGNKTPNRLLHLDEYYSDVAIVCPNEYKNALLRLGYALYIFSFIQTVVVCVYMHATQRNFGIVLAFGIYLLMQFVLRKFHTLYYEFASYLKHILCILNWNGYVLRKFKWDQIFHSPADMITGIQSVYEIMYGLNGSDEVRLVYQNIVNHDIASVIVEYLWIPLPDPDNIANELSAYLEYKNNLCPSQDIELVLS